MVGRDGAAIRKERIQEITKRIVSLLVDHNELGLDETVATLQYEQGLTKEKILEYLQIGDSLGRFELDLEGNKIRKMTEG